MEQPPEFFVRLAVDTETGDLSVYDDHPAYRSAEDVAIYAFWDLMLGHGEHPIDLVLTTHARDATEECRALLTEIREINGELFDFNLEYDISGSIADNAARVRHCHDTGRSKRVSKPWPLFERRGFY
jgi:hypothetical protein